MRKVSVEELLRDMLSHYSLGTDRIVVHVKTEQLNDRPVLGALLNLFADKAGMVPEVHGVEQRIPQFVWCHPNRITNLERILLEIQRRKFKGMSGTLIG